MSTESPAHQSAAAQTVTVIDGGRRGPSLAVLKEVVAYRSVMYALIRRAVTTRYRQSVGGIVWILAGPISTAATYSVFLGNFAHVKGDKGAPYVLFTLVGTIVWGIFLRGGIGGMNALVAGGGFVKKVYFPRVMLPLSTVGQSLADLVPASLMMFFVSIVAGEGPRLSWFLILIPFLTVTLLSVAFSMATSAINVYFRDLSYASSLIQQFGMMASAIVFPLSAIPSQWRTLYAIVNPIAGAADGARAVMYRHDGLNLAITFGGLAWSIALLLAAFVLFSMLERNAADRI